MYVDWVRTIQHRRMCVSACVCVFLFCLFLFLCVCVCVCVCVRVRVRVRVYDGKDMFTRKMHII